MSAEPSVFQTEQSGKTLIVCPQGNGLGFRYADVQIESNNIRRRLSEPAVENLVIDLASLDYFGSEVIGVFITLAREVTNRGGKAALCGASEKMQQVLDNMKLSNLWPHFASRDEALQYVQAG